MELEKTEEMRSVREGYVVLLRATAQLLIPKEDHPVMRSFYQRIADACMSWCVEIYGERLRAQYLALSDTKERSRFHTARYRFWMRSPWQEGDHITILCESERTERDGTVSFYRICHTWNVKEETVLPQGQLLRLLNCRLSKGEMPFAPNGIYREGDRVVIYQNQTERNRFLEAKLPIEGLS